MPTNAPSSQYPALHLVQLEIAFLTVGRNSRGKPSTYPHPVNRFGITLVVVERWLDICRGMSLFVLDHDSRSHEDGRRDRHL